MNCPGAVNMGMARTTCLLCAEALPVISAALLTLFTLIQRTAEAAAPNREDSAILALHASCGPPLPARDRSSDGTYWAARRLSSHAELEELIESNAIQSLSLLAMAAEDYGETMRWGDFNGPDLQATQNGGLPSLLSRFQSYINSRCDSWYFEVAVSYLLHWAPEVGASVVVRSSSRLKRGTVISLLEGLLPCYTEVAAEALRALAINDPTRFQFESDIKSLKMPRFVIDELNTVQKCDNPVYSPAELSTIPTERVTRAATPNQSYLDLLYWLLPETHIVRLESIVQDYIPVVHCRGLEPTLRQLMSDSASTSRDFATRNAARILGLGCAPEAHEWLAGAVQKGWTRIGAPRPKVQIGEIARAKRDPVAWLGHVALRDGLAFANSPLLKGVLLDTPDPRDADLIATVTWEPGPERERIRKKLLAWQKKYPKDAAIQAALLSITPRLP
jgi:hypothetical protein